MLRILTLTVSVFLFLLADSQNFEWLKSYGTKNSRTHIHKVCAEESGGCVALLEYQAPAKYDTLKLGNLQYNSFSQYSTIISFLIRLDSLGNVIKFINLGGVLAENLCRDDAGNFIVGGTMNTDSTFFDSSKVYRKNGRIVLAKYDQNLNRIWINQFGITLLSKSGIPSVGLEDLQFSQGHILFTTYGRDTIQIGSKIYNLLNNSLSDNQVFGEINATTGNVIWSQNLYNNAGAARDFTFRELEYLKGSIYISAICYTKLKIGKDTFSYGHYLLRTDSVGNYQERIRFKNMAVGTIATDGVQLYLGVSTWDSITWGNKTYLSKFPSNIRRTEFGVASLSSDLKEGWFFKPDILDISRPYGEAGGLLASTCNEGYAYFIGYFTTKIKIDSNILDSPGGADQIILKMDYRGNVLWANQGGVSPRVRMDINAIAGKHVIAGGVFSKIIHFGDFKDTGLGKENAWIVKMSDNSIFRGDVKKGPYCAGDTILVPYTKEGEFDSTNYFVAELSDEYGNFESGFRELGRIKSNKSGRVVGRLPLFQVFSSGQYRIRIRSTKPAVQSFYRIDTLRLLIYSRDKADPGLPETICLGDSIRLKTYGGTSWNWSPKYNMDNSQLRQPTVWPIKDTTYQIIISDSSGCGLADTAFKRITIRSLPKINLDFKDTLICEQTKLRIPANFEQGDSNYRWQWWEYNPGNYWMYLANKTGKNADTLNFTTTQTGLDSITIALVLNDGCKSKSDTVFILVQQILPDSILNTFKDTLVCSGVTLNYLAKNKGTLSKNTQWQWRNLTNNQIISSSGNLSYSNIKTSKIQVTLNTGCATDSAQFTITAKAPLKLAGNLTDTSICYGSNLVLNATATGGESKKHKFVWLLDKDIISTTKQVVLKTDSSFSSNGETKILSVILSDNCSLPNDTIKKTIMVNASPIADFSYVNACHLTPINFVFSGKIPPSPITNVFTWDFNGEGNSNLPNPSQQLNGFGMKQIKLKVQSSNSCSDSIVKTIEIKVESQADFSAKDVCELDSAHFINNSTNAVAFRWKFGDGVETSVASPKHVYRIDGVTKTFNVSLVAISGCSDSITKAITINANPNSEFSYIKNGSSLDLKALQLNNTKYKWKFGDLDSVVSSNPNCTFTITNSKQYNVCLEVSNLAECVSQTCKDLSLGINNPKIQLGFKLYPNPNQGIFTLEIDKQLTEGSIQIYDISGGLIHFQQLNSNTKIYNFNLDLSQGIYLVRFTNDGFSYHQRLVIADK